MRQRVYTNDLRKNTDLVFIPTSIPTSFLKKHLKFNVYQMLISNKLIVNNKLVRSVYLNKNYLNLDSFKQIGESKKISSLSFKPKHSINSTTHINSTPKRHINSIPKRHTKPITPCNAFLNEIKHDFTKPISDEIVQLALKHLKKSAQFKEKKHNGTNH